MAQIEHDHNVDDVVYVITPCGVKRGTVTMVLASRRGLVSDPLVYYSVKLTETSENAYSTAADTFSTLQLSMDEYETRLA